MARPRAFRPRHMQPAANRWLPFLFIGLAISMIVLAASNQFVTAWHLETGGRCNVKGNISAGGERIYHVPGGMFYDATVISPIKGERWFCSETEAVAAGWRRSYR